MDNLGIYLHWPYCKSKCPYCDFFSRIAKQINQDEIIAGYLRQLEQYKDMLGKRRIKSVFFGGGTPSLIKSENIAKILNQIDKLWGIDKLCEITLEANPNTNETDLFFNLHNAGINRLSLGVQSLDDTELKFLGRTHNAGQALAAIDEVLNNFDNHSVDLMYALPMQTLTSWDKQLEKICSLGLKHLSLYQLTIEEGTVFARKNIKPMVEDEAAELYQFTADFLLPQGYQRYEVSNYALTSYESVHNQIYWQGGDYIGIGPSAHGRLRLKNKIYAQTDKLQLEELTSKERAEELIIMGLRLTQGINKADFKQCCGCNFDEYINQNFKKSMIEQGLLAETKDNLKATPKGFLVLDYLISSLVP